MSTKYIQPGDVLTFVAPTGGVTSGVPVLIGGNFVIPVVTALVGVSFEGMIVGAHSMPKTASQAWAVGQRIAWDIANARADSDLNVGPVIGVAAGVVGSGSGETTGVVKLAGHLPATRIIRKRVAIADVNAGAVLVKGRAGIKLRLIDALAIAYGGAVGAVTTVDVIGTLSSARKLVAFAQANLTQSTLLRAGGTGAAILADGASFTANDAAADITVGITGSSATTATGIDFELTVAEEQA
jgi:predicted RecA/RadA family phage recombinase